MVVDQAADAAQVIFQRTAQFAAVLGELGRMGVDQAPDADNVGFERLGEHGAALGNLLDLVGDKAVDRGAAVGEFAEIGLQRARQYVAAFSQLSDVASNHFINDRTGLDK